MKRIVKAKGTVFLYSQEKRNIIFFQKIGMKVKYTFNSVSYVAGWLSSIAHLRVVLRADVTWSLRYEMYFPWLLEHGELSRLQVRLRKSFLFLMH